METGLFRKTRKNVSKLYVYCKRNTVSEVLALAESHALQWPIPEALSNSDIEHLFYSDRGNNEGRKLPDCNDE